MRRKIRLLTPIHRSAASGRIKLRPATGPRSPAMHRALPALTALLVLLTGACSTSGGSDGIDQSSPPIPGDRRRHRRPPGTRYHRVRHRGSRHRRGLHRQHLPGPDRPQAGHWRVRRSRGRADRARRDRQPRRLHLRHGLRDHGRRRLRPLLLPRVRAARQVVAQRLTSPGAHRDRVCLT